MAIDIHKETLLSMAQAADSLPARRSGKKAAQSTIFRWIQVGLRGVRLEFLQVGGSRYTSREALQRFFEALTVQGNPATSPPTAAEQRAAVKRAEEILDRAGIKAAENAPNANG